MQKKRILQNKSVCIFSIFIILAHPKEIVYSFVSAVLYTFSYGIYLLLNLQLTSFYYQLTTQIKNWFLSAK